MLKIIDSIKNNLSLKNKYIIKKIIEDSKISHDECRDFLNYVKEKYKIKKSRIQKGKYSYSFIIKQEDISFILTFDKDSTINKCKFVFSDISYFIPINGNSFLFSENDNKKTNNSFIFRKNDNISNLTQDSFISYITKKGMRDLDFYENGSFKSFKIEIIDFFLENSKISLNEIKDLNYLITEEKILSEKKEDINLILESLFILNDKLNKNINLKLKNN